MTTAQPGLVRPSGPARSGTSGVGQLLGRPLLAWFLTRLVALALGGLAVALVRGNVFFDTEHYARWAHGTVLGSKIPYRDFPWEYPPGALPPMLLPGVLTWWYPADPATPTSSRTAPGGWW